MSGDRGRRPTREQLDASYGKRVRDVIAPDLEVLFCGINPGLYTAAIGHHFGRPGNRFWTVLHASGFTPRMLTPYDERELLRLRLGVTNVVNKATRVAEELTAEDLRRGAAALERKVRRYRPRALAILGLGAYRVAFARPKAVVGRQAAGIGPTEIWVLPNPSGRTASYQLDAFVRLFRELRRAVAQARGTNTYSDTADTIRKTSPADSASSGPDPRSAPPIAEPTG